MLRVSYLLGGVDSGARGRDNEWFIDLARHDQDTADHVEAAIDLLAAFGPGLGRPAVDTITGSDVHNMKELRAFTVRILFVFDPQRQAVLLVAGDKAGQWQRWYEENIPIAEQRYTKWLAGGYKTERQ